MTNKEKIKYYKGTTFKEGCWLKCIKANKVGEPTLLEGSYYQITNSSIASVQVVDVNGKDIVTSTNKFPQFFLKKRFTSLSHTETAI